MVERNNAAARGGVLSFVTSPAVVVSVLLALLGAYIWEEHPVEAIVAFLWIPIFLTGWFMHFVFDSSHQRQSYH
jgi:hypothetical protein